MANIRANYRLRIVFLLLNVVLAFLCYELIQRENGKEWKTYQREFRDHYIALLTSSSKQASTTALPSGKVEHVQRKLSQLKAFHVEIKQIFLPEANVRDLCTTCHLGIDNPLFANSPQPFRTHPGQFLKHHKVNQFGCTLCHQGMGVGTTKAAAHGIRNKWQKPLIPREYAQSTCVACHETSFMLKDAEKLELGRKVFVRKGCYGCHLGKGLEKLRKVAGPLDGIESKLSNPAWLYAWLNNPKDLRKQTLMPNFRLTDKEVGDIAAFLFSLDAKVIPREYSSKAASAKNGRTLFVERGCAGCHSVRKEELGVSARVPNLSSVGLKVKPEWVMAWLEDPRSYNPESLMPKIALTNEERQDITAYLMTLTENAGLIQSKAKFDAERYDRTNGKKLVQLYGCYGCHTINNFEQLGPPGIDVSELTHKALDELPFGHSTVERSKWAWIQNKIKSPRIYQTQKMPLRMPEFDFEQGEIEALTTYYLNNDKYDLSDAFLVAASPRVRTLQQGDRLIALYNCRGCHMIEKGEKPVIAQHLKLKSMIPPRLVGEGEKVQPQWLFDFLSKPSPLRPWMKINMPNFGFDTHDVETFVSYFRERSADAGITSPYVRVPKREDLSEEELGMGEYRLRTDKCVQCHPAKLDADLLEHANVEDLSIDLMLAKKRLRFKWLKDFLRNPDRYAGANTKMPFVFYDPGGTPKMPDPEMWIDVTAKYLMVMEHMPKPTRKKQKNVRPGSDVDWTKYDK